MTSELSEPAPYIDGAGSDRSRGHVTLVGGGPGAPDLLTLRGWRALARADVVVADRLCPREVLDELGPDVEIVDVGKSAGHHPVPQEEINALLVRHARLGRRVVRLKGGDPFLFGRGGEEVAACRAAGIPVDVVPGVSSAFAVPALAGIPVTHRGTTTAVHVVTGHVRAGSPSGARVPDDVLDDVLDDVAVGCVVEQAATLVVLMGVAALPAITRRLLDAGADPATPVAIVERGSTPDERVTRAALDLAAKRADEVGVTAPAVIVIGGVAAEGVLGGAGGGTVGDPDG